MAETHLDHVRIHYKSVVPDDIEEEFKTPPKANIELTFDPGNKDRPPPSVEDLEILWKLRAAIDNTLQASLEADDFTQGGLILPPRMRLLLQDMITRTCDHDHKNLTPEEYAKGLIASDLAARTGVKV